MIENLSHSQDAFPIGTIGDIAILATNIVIRCLIEIKNRTTDHDRTIVSLKLFECLNNGKLSSIYYMVYMYFFTNTE